MIWNPPELSVRNYNPLECSALCAEPCLICRLIKIGTSLFIGLKILIFSTLGLQIRGNGRREWKGTRTEGNGLSYLLVQQGELAEAGEVVHSAFVEEGFPDFLDGISRPADFAGGVSYVHALQVAKDDLHFCGTDVEGGEVRPCLLLKGIILGSGGMSGVPEEHPSGGGVGCRRYGAQGQP